MKNEGDVFLARERFFLKRHPNLHILLKNRFSWMNKYLHNEKINIELGLGAGFSRKYIDKEIILSDIEKKTLDRFGARCT